MCILAYSSVSLTSRDFCQILRSSRSTAPSCFCRPFTAKTPQKSGRMCNRITAHARRYDYHLVRASPRHPASVRTCLMGLPVLFRFLAHSLTTFGRWGCGERCHLSHVVGDSAVILSGMSRQMALKRAQKLSDARNGLKCPSGHGRRENALQTLSGGQARRYP